MSSFLDDARQQRRAIGARVPVYDRILALIESSDLASRLERAWGDRSFFAFYDRPLLFLASLRFDALLEGESHPLWRAIAADEPDVDAATLESLAAATDPVRERFWRAVRERAVQTNETSRAVVWLWPAWLAGARRVALIDLGASAGLNLIADELPSLWSVPVVERIDAVVRLGLDRSPLDARREQDAAWLRACVWAGESARERRLAQAIATFRAAAARPDAPSLEPLRAPDFPSRLGELVTSVQDADVWFLAYQSIIREYLSPEERDRHRTGMFAWLTSLPPGRAAWLELELEPGSREHPAVITAHVHDEIGRVVSLPLARCAYHPSTIEADEQAVARFRAVTRGSGARPATV